MAKRFLITSDRIGKGDDDLGAVLMRNFLYSLAREELTPVAIHFVNAGVRLACEGSSSLDDLRILEEKGVALRACGTCLEYLGLKESLAVGEIGAMPGLVSAMCGSDEVVTIA